MRTVFVLQTSYHMMYLCCQTSSQKTRSLFHLLLSCAIYSLKYQWIFTFYTMYQYWQDYLATQGARAFEDIGLTYLFQSLPITAYLKILANPSSKPEVSKYSRVKLWLVICIPCFDVKWGLAKPLKLRHRWMITSWRKLCDKVTFPCTYLWNILNGN